MMKRLFFTFIIVLVLSQVCCVAAEPEKEESFTLTDIIKRPLEAILAPVGAGGLAELVVAPADAILSPVIDHFGDALVVTPGRTPEHVYNINKNITVITADQIQDMTPRDLQRIISRETGVVVSGFFGNAKDNSVDMRGFGEAGPMNYVLLLDGRRTNQIDMSGPDLSQIDVRSIDRIEITRGANSVLYGDNATGGVINIITKKGEKGYHIQYTQEMGSFQYHKEYVSFDGSGDFMDYFFSYSWQDSDGYRLNGGYEANDIFTSLVVRPEDSLAVYISGGYHRDWYGQPGALYDGNIQSDGRDGSRFPDSKAKTEEYYITVDPRILIDTPDHEGVISFFKSFRSRRVNSLSVGFNRYEMNHHITSFDLRPKCEINSLFFDERLENKLVFGVDYFHATDQILSGDITSTKSQLDIIKDTFGIYASDTMLVDKRWILSGGVRGEWAEYKFDQYQPASSYDKRSLREAAFDAGVGYKYNERSQIYANYARSYRYPTTDEYFASAFESAGRVFPATLNTALKQQVANNYEVGIKDNSFDILSLNAAYYLMDVKNELYYDPVAFTNANYHHTVHHGLELEARTELFEKVEGFFDYNFQKAFFVGGKFASNDIPMVPEHKISGGVVVTPIEGFSVNFAVNYLGKRYMVSDQMNTVSRIKSHVTLDVGMSFKYKNLRIFGSIKNLLDEKYFSNATKDWKGDPAFYPAPERTFECGATVRF